MITGGGVQPSQTHLDAIPLLLPLVHLILHLDDLQLQLLLLQGQLGLWGAEGRKERESLVSWE